MKMNSTKMIMMKMIVLTSIMILTSNNMIISWMAMEINMIAFLPLMSKSTKMKDQMMKYFIIQSTSSSLMLMSIMINSWIESPVNLSVMLMISLIMKMGLMPLHIWLPPLMNTLSWNNCMLMTTIQKVIPVMISSQIISSKIMVIPMSISMIMGPIAALSQLSLKKILSFSSISNTPLMIISMNNSKQQFMLFMTIYSMITIMTMKKMKDMNISFVNQMMTMSKVQKMNMIILALSMSGMPPTTGFLPKWIILQSIITKSTILSMSMICSSILSTFIYISLMSKPLLIQTKMKKMKKKKMIKSNEMTFNLIGLPTMLILKSI
uniref:NADH dehydrogenase subunit 2 n=1 Tax=Flata truncata TaxID=3081121 RepID=UPI002A7EEA2C|nr:NADH dehydrogenase subunit 2 [Flata truncata]WOW99048.1 NADH dehydrogenase subunit 2 [Flata truncata]